MRKFYFKNFLRKMKGDFGNVSKVTLVAAVGFSSFLQAQVNSYVFSQSNGTFTELTNPTVLATATSATLANSMDTASYDVTLPFAFKFRDADQTSLKVRSDGYITFGTTSQSGSTPISATTAYQGVISAWAKDINAAFLQGVVAGQISWGVVGTAPNREVVIQWKNVRPAYSSNEAMVYGFSFQIRLKESSNAVSIVYHKGQYFTGSDSLDGNVQIGLRGGDNKDFNNRFSLAGSLFTNSSAGIANDASQVFSTVNTSTGMPTTGLTYTWTPSNCRPPINVTLTSTSTSSIDVVWEAPVSPSDTPSSYELYYSTEPISPDYAVTGQITSLTGTSTTVTGLQSSTLYHVWMRSVCGNDKGAWVYVNKVGTQCSSMTSLFENFDSYATGTVMPHCFVRLMEGTGTLTISSTSPFSGNRNIQQTSTTSQASSYLVLPHFSNVSAGTHQLRFRVRSTSATAGSLRIGYLTDDTDPSTFVEFTTVDVQNTTYGPDSEKIIPVPNFVPASAKLAFGNTNDGKTYYYDDISYEPLTNCLKPTDVKVNGITNVTAVVNWMDSVSTPTSYEIYYSTSSAVPTASTTASVTGVSGVSGTITGLQPGTTYYVWVRSSCGTEKSYWTDAVNFTTECSAVTTYTQDFESASGTALPQCWYRLVPDSSVGVLNINATNGVLGSKAVYQKSTATQNSIIGVLPRFSNVSAGTHQLRFRAKGTSVGGMLEVGYVTDFTDYNSFVAIQPVDVPNTYDDASSEIVVVIPSTIPANARLAIKNPSDNIGYYWDNLSWDVIPNCQKPSDVTVTNVTDTAANVTWMASSSNPNAYEVYYSQSSTLPNASTVPSLSVSNAIAVDLTNLTPNTEYYVWVRSVCSATDKSDWSLVKSFTTFCSPISSMDEKFDTLGTGAVVPTCWERVAPATGAGTFTVSSTTPVASGNRHVNMRTTSSQTPVVGVLPYFSNISAGTHWIRFKARLASAGNGNVQVGYISDITDPNNFIEIASIPVSNTTYVDPASDKSLIIPTYVPANARLAIRNAEDVSVFVDDVVWEPIPACFRPTDITYSNITSTTADVLWMAPTTQVPANGYDIYYSTSSVAPDSTTIPTITGVASITSTLSGLTPNTVYYVWVRSNCGADNSVWTSGLSFRTECAATDNFFEDFDNEATGAALPMCWIRLVDPAGSSTLSIVATNGTYGTKGVTQYTSATSATAMPVLAVLPEFLYLDQGTHRLRFRARTSSSTGTGLLHVGYVTDATNSASFVNIESINVTNATFTDALNEYSVNIPTSVPANARLAIVNEKDGKTYYWDEVAYERIPNCERPMDVTVSNIANNQAQINWLAPTITTPSSYEVYYNTTGVVPDASTVPQITGVVGLNTVITNLQPATKYYVWVRSSCGVGLDGSSWTREVDFITLCLPSPIQAGQDVTVCMNGTGTLTASTDAASTVRWFDAPTGGTLLATGSTFVTPALTATTTYYASASIGEDFAGGRATPGTSVTSGAGVGAFGIVFNVQSNLSLRQVTVYPVSTSNAAGTVTVSLLDADNNILTKKTFDVQGAPLSDVVPHVLDLDFYLLPGTYKLAMYEKTGISGLIFDNSNTSNLTYPYSIGGALNITHSTMSTTNTASSNIYYYFYDWKIHTGCESDRMPIVVNVDPSCNVAGTIEVSQKDSVVVYPNPFTDVINISNTGDVKMVKVIDASGKLVKVISGVNGPVDLAELKEGLYLLNIVYKNEEVVTTKVIKK